MPTHASTYFVSFFLPLSLSFCFSHTFIHLIRILVCLHICTHNRNIPNISCHKIVNHFLLFHQFPNCLNTFSSTDTHIHTHTHTFTKRVAFFVYLHWCMLLLFSCIFRCEMSYLKWDFCCFWFKRSLRIRT